MHLCFKCAANHPEPTGHFCTGPLTEGRSLRSVLITAAPRGLQGAGAAIDMSNNQVVTDADMDEEERTLVAELKVQEQNTRKLKLRAKIAQQKLQNEALEAGPGPGQGSAAPTNSPPNSPAPPGPPSDKDSKYALARFLPKLDNIRKASFTELLFAALEWAVNTEVPEGALKGYLQHLSYLCLMHMPDIYPPDASVEYDMAVREKADSRGLTAFGPGDSNLTMRHYGMSNTWEGRRLAHGSQAAPPASKKKATGGVATAPRQQPPALGREHSCLLFNWEECAKGPKCRFPHICRHCGGDHKAVKCTTRK